MILVRHPHCWRFLFPLPPGLDEPTAEDLRDKALAFIGGVGKVERGGLDASDQGRCRSRLGGGRRAGAGKNAQQGKRAMHGMGLTLETGPTPAA